MKRTTDTKKPNNQPPRLLDQKELVQITGGNEGGAVANVMKKRNEMDM
jgi:hypothetical protein